MHANRIGFPLRGLLVIFWITMFLLPVVSPIAAQDDVDERPFTQVARIGRGNVRQVMWSPQGDELAVVTARGVWLYDAARLSDSPRLFAPPDLDMGLTATLAIAPTWEFIAGVNHDGQVTAWSMNSGDVVFTSDDANLQERRLAYSPDGSLLLVAQGNHWRVWAMPSGKRVGGDDYANIDERVRPYLVTAVTVVAFSADGVRYGIATTMLRSDEVNSITYIFDSQTHELLAREGEFEVGEIVLTEALGLNTGLVYEVENVQLDNDQDGRTETLFGIVSLYDVDDATRTFVTALPTDRYSNFYGGVRDFFAISPDATQIVVSDRAGSIWVWDIQAAIETPPCLVVPPTGSTSGREPDDYTILGLNSVTCDAIWSARVTFTHAHVPLTTLLATDETRYEDNANYSPDNRWRLIEPDRENPTFRMEYLETGNMTELEVLYPDAQIQAVVFTSDGQYVIAAFTSQYPVDVGDTVIRVWQIDGDTVNPVSIATLTGHTDRITSLALSQDERLLVSASYDRTAQVWDTTTWEIITVLTHDTLLNNATFGEDADTILTAGTDGVVYVWRRG